MKETFHGMQELEEAYAIQKRARELHLPALPVVSWGAELYTPTGELIEKILGKSNSFVRNYFQAVSYCAGFWYGYGIGYMSISQSGMRDINNTIRNPHTSSYKRAVMPTVTSDDTTYHSLVVGYSDTAESVDDYKLGNEFARGTAVNQLVRASIIGDRVRGVSPECKYFIVSRIFTNGYSAEQTIKELGHIVKCTMNGGDFMFLWLRDVLPTPITLQPGDSIRMSYTYKTLFE